MTSLKVIRCLNDLELIGLHTSIAVVSTWLKGFNYCISNIKFYSILTDCLKTVKWLQVLLSNTNYSIEHY